MNHKLSTTNNDLKNTDQSTVRFYIETLEIDRLSALPFFEAGEKSFEGMRYFWQNREKNFTLVGLGNAYTIESNEENQRYTNVENQWKQLLQGVDYENLLQQPILFGSFTFDPKKGVSDEWSNFSHANFALATHQLVIRNEKAYVNTHIVSKQNISEEQISKLLAERDEIIHQAQVKGSKTYAKPVVNKMTEPFKEEYLKSISNVTDAIKDGQADKVVIARSLALRFEEKVDPTNVLTQVYNEQPESYLFGQENGENLFFGASPERLVSVKDGQAYSSCIAGNR